MVKAGFFDQELGLIIMTWACLKKHPEEKRFVGYLENLILTFGHRIIKFFFVSLLFFIHFLCTTGWMRTSPAGSYDGNWSLIVGCLPCVVGYHLQLVVFLIGSHLSLGNIGQKQKSYACPQKRDHLKKRFHLPTLGFHGIFVRFGGAKNLVLKLRAETSSSSTWTLLSLEGGRPQGFVDGLINCTP